MDFCAKCGNKLNKGDSFCKGCGEKVLSGTGSTSTDATTRVVENIKKSLGAYNTINVVGRTIVVEKHYNTMKIIGTIDTTPNSMAVKVEKKATGLAWAIGILGFPGITFLLWIYMSMKTGDRIRTIESLLRGSI